MLIIAISMVYLCNQLLCLNESETILSMLMKISLHNLLETIKLSLRCGAKMAYQHNRHYTYSESEQGLSILAHAQESVDPRKLFVLVLNIHFHISVNGGTRRVFCKLKTKDRPKNIARLTHSICHPIERSKNNKFISSNF